MTDLRRYLEDFLSERRWSLACAIVAAIAFVYTVAAASVGHEQFATGGVYAAVGICVVWAAPRLLATVLVVLLRFLEHRS
jgi:hypothetical protein